MIEALLPNINNSLYKDANPRYLNNNVAVPRVTEILSAMLHEDFLMEWANRIGLYKRQKYKETLEKAARIGTYSHDLVEQYIRNQIYNIDVMGISSRIEYDSAKNAVESFRLWYNDVFTLNNTINILGIEERLTCRWFGGTYDMLIEINGRIYLVDFKTSNHISYKYCLQISAYMYMLKLDRDIHIDGAIILQLDKKTPCYTEYILDFSNEIHKSFIEDCEECFLSLVYSYYQRLNIESQYKIIF